jgi:hypothetical protein
MARQCHTGFEESARSPSRSRLRSTNSTLLVLPAGRRASTAVDQLFSLAISTRKVKTEARHALARSLAGYPSIVGLSLVVI